MLPHPILHTVILCPGTSSALSAMSRHMGLVCMSEGLCSMPDMYDSMTDLKGGGAQRRAPVAIFGR